ncbi:ABC transporter permease [Elusimicrobiota bacterium]
MKTTFSITRAFAIAKKELMHILRDPFTLGLGIGMPIIFVIFFGFAIDFDFKDVKVAVYDFDNSRQSRQLSEIFSASGYFKALEGKNPGNPIYDVESERAFASMVIKPGFAKNLVSGKSNRVQILIDGTDNQKSGVVAGYFMGIYNAALSRFSDRQIRSPVKLETRFKYNPELNSKWFIVPGLIVLVVGLLSILMTALTVAREWENGSMELLLSTPVTPLEIVMGKITPYVGLVFIGIFIVYFISLVFFNVPFMGSYIFFFIACLVYIFVSLAEGILISVITRQQQKAMQFSFVAGLLPSLILSGFIFPVENMPAFFQYFTMILPPRWFMTIIRAVFLKGSGLLALWVPFSILVVMGTVLVIAAAKKFKRDIEQ